MTGHHDTERKEPVHRRAFLKKSSAAVVGLGGGLDVQEEAGIQYYSFVLPDRGIVSTDFVNKFLFVTEPGTPTETVPFENCFTQTEPGVEEQFQQGVYEYPGIIVDATEWFQLFGGNGAAVERLRELLNGNVELPETLEGNIGEIATTRIFVPETVAPLPTTEGYRSVGGEPCETNFVRLRVHELPDEVDI